jgi:DMSO/TMAO reductase YedYZ molybdopterin-dependent catalytic subunit
MSVNEQEWRLSMRIFRKNRIAFSLVMAVMFSTLLAGCGGAPNVDWELSITGDVSNPTTLSFKDLAGMPQVDLNDVLMEKSTGEDMVTSWSGVSVADLFAQAGVPDTYVSVTAFAADGYAIEITRDEMSGAIIALKDQGEWIAEVTPDRGPIRLVCPQTPGNRWVFQITELHVNQ